MTLFGDGGCAIHWLARPHLFTLLFFVVTVHITTAPLKAAHGFLRGWFRSLLLWTNLHGGFFVVFLVLACYSWRPLNECPRSRYLVAETIFAAKNALAFKTFSACFGVTFINPYGWQLHNHIVEYIADPYQLQHISEFQAEFPLPGSGFLRDR